MYGGVTTSSKSNSGGYSSCELSQPSLSIKPQSLVKLIQITRFTREELKSLYRSFKQSCPLGVLDKTKFVEIYNCFFPPGASESYAEMVFRVIDKDQTGSLFFEEFALALSNISRGSHEQKIDFIFSLYDIDNDGFITKSKISQVTKAIFGLMGPLNLHFSEKITSTLNNQIEEKTLMMLETFDLDKDGKISRNDFFETFQRNPELIQSLSQFDSYY